MHRKTKNYYEGYWRKPANDPRIRKGKSYLEILYQQVERGEMTMDEYKTIMHIHNNNKTKIYKNFYLL